MMIRHLLAAACIGAITIISANGDSDDLIELVLNHGESNEVRLSCHQGTVQPVSVHINDRLPFTLAAIGNKKYFPVWVADLDGGQINAVLLGGDVAISGNPTPPTLALSEEGIVDLAFQAGTATGVFRFLVTVGVEQYQLRIYVVNP